MAGYIKKGEGLSVTYQSIAGGKSFMHNTQSVGRISRSTSFPSALTATEPKQYQCGVKLITPVLTTYDLGYWDADEVFSFLKDNELVYEFSRKRGLIDARETFLSSHALWLQNGNIRNFFILAFPQFEYALDSD